MGYEAVLEATLLEPSGPGSARRSSACAPSKGSEINVVAYNLKRMIASSELRPAHPRDERPELLSDKPSRASEPLTHRLLYIAFLGEYRAYNRGLRKDRSAHRNPAFLCEPMRLQPLEPVLRQTQSAPASPRSPASAQSTSSARAMTACASTGLGHNESITFGPCDELAARGGLTGP
jgi:hypothetical protein